MDLTPQEIEAYLNEFNEKTNMPVPKRALQYFNSAQYEQLNGKEVTELLPGWGYESPAELEIDLDKMTMLVDFSNDGYFDSTAIYLPIATIVDTTNYLGLKINDGQHKIYYFDFEEGFTEQAYMLDELLEELL